nr:MULTISPECIES: hypothetical protein [unclassified Ochrobactrum]
MKIFGKMIETPERVKIPPVQIGVDDDGEPIFGPEQEYPILITSLSMIIVVSFR